MIGTRDVKKAVIEALGVLRDERAVSPLLDMLSKDNPKVKGDIIEALANMGYKSATNYLRKMLEDEEDPILVKALAAALRELYDMQAVNILQERLEQAEDNYEQRIIVEALGELRDQRALSRLQSLLRRKRDELRPEQRALSNAEYAAEAAKRARQKKEGSHRSIGDIESDIKSTEAALSRLPRGQYGFEDEQVLESIEIDNLKSHLASLESELRGAQGTGYGYSEAERHADTVRFSVNRLKEDIEVLEASIEAIRV